MKHRSFNAWYYFGIVGLLVFILTRPLIDFNAFSPISETPRVVKDKARFLAEEIGLNSDTLAVYLQRVQNVTLFKQLKDSINYLPSPAILQYRGVPLTYWDVSFIDADAVPNVISTESLQSKTVLKVRLNDVGKVVQLEVEPQFQNALFYQGDSLPEIAESIVQNVFGFGLSNYRLDTQKDTSIQLETQIEASQNKMIISKQSENKYEFVWRKNDLSQTGPLKMTLELQPQIKTFERGELSQGVGINSFKTVFVNETIEESDSENNDLKEAYFFFVSLLVLIGLVITVAVRQILKGMVEWKRGFIMLFVGIILIGSWRGLYFFQSQSWVLSNAAAVSYIFNTLLYALMVGIFAALAYMAWDSLARKQRHIQLPIIDAIWQGKLFYKETGKAIIYGYAASGTLLGVFAVALIGFNLSFYQYDSQFSFAEATSVIPVLTIPLNALGIAILGLIAHFGLSTSLVQEWFKKPVWSIPLSFVLSGFLLTGIGRFFGTEGTHLQDFLIFSMLLVPLTLAYRQLGYLTVTVAWGAFAMVLFMTSYYNPNSTSIIIQFLILLGVYLFPLIFGFIAARFGASIVDERRYIPEYEEKISRQLRFEKEIEIARESQFELLPVNTPELPEAMICGFFIPSFEVGGDYYDYFLKYDEDGNPRSLAITVVDVSGKAMKAAMHAVHTSGLILSRFPTDTPEQVLSMINPFIHQKTDKKTFITAIAAEYDFESKILRVANAGHCLPVLKRNGKAEFINTPAPRYPLGIMRKVDYKAVEIQLQSGDNVLFYSDGLPEAQNTRKQRFGFENVLKLMEDVDSEKDSSLSICQYIKRKVQTFSAYQMADDTTIVALKIN